MAMPAVVEHAKIKVCCAFSRVDPQRQAGLDRGAGGKPDRQLREQHPAGPRRPVEQDLRKHWMI
jgi:hypothetical protein